MPVDVVLTLVWSVGCWVMDAVREWMMRQHGWRDDLGSVGLPDRVVAVTLIVWGMWGLWWWRYVREYLRLPRAGWVALCLVLIGLMAGIVLARPVEGALQRGWGEVAGVWNGVLGAGRW